MKTETGRKKLSAFNLNQMIGNKAEEKKNTMFMANEVRQPDDGKNRMSRGDSAAGRT